MSLYSLGNPSNIDPTPSSNAAITSMVVGTTSLQVLAANPNRKGFSVMNTSNRTLYLGISGSVTSTSGCFVIIPPNTLYVWSMQTIFTGAIFAVASAANGLAQVFELTP